MYLAVLYAGLPALLANTGAIAVLPAFVPFMVDTPGLLLPILAQLALLAVALAWRWRQITVTESRFPSSA